jgi:hypothetical protein
MARSCPICGAYCQCRNRGLDGTCCPCHRHKVRHGIRPEFYITANLTKDEVSAVERHLRDMDWTFEEILKDWHARLRLREYGVAETGTAA